MFAGFKLSLVACVGFLAACGGTTDNEQLRPGVLEFYSDPVQITTPATVNAGETFKIEILTYGGGCVSFGETQVSKGDGLVEIEPLDNEIQLEEDEACTLELKLLDHSVEVSLDSPGTTTVVVHGRREPEGESITVERTIVVE